ncbi:MAG: hypothetical protein K0Q87_3613 [Neobacillus sp.]|jgi:hypothetical protein|nr:hypothetical protein [Neobacillus sp.]
MATWWGKTDILSRYIDLDDIELIGSPWITVGVPYNSQVSFIKNVYTGACAYRLGLSSIDYTYKKYVKDQNIIKSTNDFDAKILEVTSSLKRGIIDVLEYLMSIEKPDIPCLFAAGAAYVRLQNTFKGAVLCLRTGLHFETLAMERIILEQLAWIYKVHNYNGDYFKILPNKCISDLKQLIPSVGIAYGILSDKLHIKPISTLDYISTKNVVLRDNRQIIQNAYLLLKIYDMFCIVGEFIYADLLKNHRYIKKDHTGKYAPCEQRVSLEVISKLHSILKELERTDSDK